MRFSSNFDLIIPEFYTCSLISVLSTSFVSDIYHIGVVSKTLVLSYVKIMVLFRLSFTIVLIILFYSFTILII